MAISDYRERVNTSEIKREALRPRRGYLVVASLFGFATLFALMYRDVLEEWVGTSFEYFFPLLLFILIALGLFLVACYRMPALGNRLLGYTVVLEKDTRETSATSFTKSFAVDSATTEKRQATRRLSARQARRKYARAARQNQENKAHTPKADE